MFYQSEQRLSWFDCHGLLSSLQVWLRLIILKDCRELLKQSISREIESQADINAVKMVINIGLPSDTCLKEYEYLARDEGTGEETKEDSSHPGYEDRRDAISEFLKTYKHSPSDRELKGTKGKWKFNRKLNTLVFTPVANK